MPRVVSMTEELVIVPRRPHAWTVGARQWHITRGGHTVEKLLQGGG